MRDPLQSWQSHPPLPAHSFFQGHPPRGASLPPYLDRHLQDHCRVLMRAGRLQGERTHHENLRTPTHAHTNTHSHTRPHTPYGRQVHVSLNVTQMSKMMAATVGLGDPSVGDDDRGMMRKRHLAYSKLSVLLSRWSKQGRGSNQQRLTAMMLPCPPPMPPPLKLTRTGSLVSGSRNQPW